MTCVAVWPALLSQGHRRIQPRADGVRCDALVPCARGHAFLSGVCSPLEHAIAWSSSSLRRVLARMCGWLQEYTKAIDVWSLGCIFAELLGTKPLFPGDDYLHQLRLIIDVLGTPTESDLSFIKSARALAFVKKQSGKPKIPFSTMFKGANPLALDLLEKMLMFNPNKRITVDQALEHPYMESLHAPEDEVVRACAWCGCVEAPRPQAYDECPVCACV